jgi:ADP-ribose pyrophosphatase YjhB (NUDIX family)
MPKAPAKTTRLRPTKEVSVMAWIEDSDQNILFVRQATGLKLWTLPGGKVKRGESLVKALKREVYEETALRVQIGSLLGVLDRQDKDALTLLFAAIPNSSSVRAKPKRKEIKKAGFQKSLPKKASPSAKYFWSARERPRAASCDRKSRHRRLASHPLPRTRRRP